MYTRIQKKGKQTAFIDSTTGRSHLLIVDDEMMRKCILI